jgi:hypothetical protein
MKKVKCCEYGPRSLVQRSAAGANFKEIVTDDETDGEVEIDRRIGEGGENRTHPHQENSGRRRPPVGPHFGQGSDEQA